MKTYIKPDLNVAKISLGVFGNYGDVDPKPVFSLPFGIDDSHRDIF